MKKKVDIGSNGKRDGWLTVDANPKSGADIISELPPVPEEVGGAGLVRMIHVLEHFHRWEAVEILHDLHRLLAPGGHLVLELPNLQSAIDTLAGRNGKRRDQWGMWVLYGDPRHQNPWYGHKWGWTPEELTRELVGAGFSIDSITRERPRFHVPDRDFRLVAQKE